jgi:hypothetical protein
MLVCRFVGIIFKAAGQPTVIGEIIAGACLACALASVKRHSAEWGQEATFVSARARAAGRPAAAGALFQSLRARRWRNVRARAFMQWARVQRGAQCLRLGDAGRRSDIRRLFVWGVLARAAAARRRRGQSGRPIWQPAPPCGGVHRGSAARGPGVCCAATLPARPLCGCRVPAPCARALRTPAGAP